MKIVSIALVLLPLLAGQPALAQTTSAQPAPAPTAQPGGRAGAAPAVRSTEILPDRQVTFRISAPQATNVRFTSADIFNLGPKAQMRKGDSGVWETTIGPLEPGAYRYNFSVDGVSVADPQSSSVSESNTHLSSLLVVPGSELMDTRDVPRGAVAQITYYSKSLGRFRRMHVYTPPGYEANQDKYPIFYLLHGAFDNAWSTVGRAGFILDNLLAAGKARPMVVVMPAGHTSAKMSFGKRGSGGAPGGAQPRDEFVEDFVKDIMPYAESHYRVFTDRTHRAIAGLSMGGMQTHRIAMANLDKFSHIGLFSGGTISPGEITDAAGFKEKVKVLFVSCGSKENPGGLQASHDALEKLGIQSTIYVSPDAQHEWRVWRGSLIQFAPLLFQDSRGEVKKAEDKKFTYLDLQPVANAKIVEHFTGDEQGEGKLRAGEQTLGGVKFKIGAKYIHLGSTMMAEMPAKVEGIKVGRTVAKLHLLQGTGWSTDDDTVIGGYVVTYEDGTRLTIPIRYGKDVVDWWYDDSSPEPSAAKVAWRGEYTKAQSANKKVRLYLMNWENPKPEQKVKTIDFANRKDLSCAPFCVAITAEGK